MTADIEKLTIIGKELLEALGENPDREGIADTPKRWAKWWAEFIDYDAGNVDTAFSHEVHDEMVVVSDLRVWTLCEHHLLPFYCDVAIGYIPNDKVLGLSKFGRIAQKHAHKLQIQERLIDDIANEIQDLTSEHVAVIGTGEHLCMTTRGVRMSSKMTTSVLRGQFRKEHAVRDEFLRLVGR